jgi:hypothetical protein
MEGNQRHVDRYYGADLHGRVVGPHAVALAAVRLPAADAVDRGRERLVPCAEHTGGMHLVVALWQLIRTGGRRHLVVGEGRVGRAGCDLRQLGVRRTAHEEHRRLQRGRVGATLRARASIEPGANR